MNAFFKAGLTALLLLCLPGSAFGEEIKAIHIVTPSWEDETNRDGTGLFFEMVRKIYEPVGIKMEYKIVPWKRAERMLTLNQADAMLYVALQNVVLSPRNPMTMDDLAAVFRKDKIREWKGLETLNGKSAVWLRGYDYDKNPRMKGITLQKWHEIDAHKQAWGMLEKGRVDVYMDALVDIEAYISKNKVNMAPYRIETLWKEKVYMAFAKSEKSKRLIQIYDKRIVELVKSGEMKKMFEKWGRKFPPNAWNE